jgi:hypothetical protein
VILCHGVRYEKDLAYRDYFEKELREHEFLGEMIGDKLLYYPAVTREPFANQGRLTQLMESGEMQRTLGLPELSPENDRAMICGSPQMLADLRACSMPAVSRFRRASASRATTCSSARSSRSDAATVVPAAGRLPGPRVAGQRPRTSQQRFNRAAQLLRPGGGRMPRHHLPLAIDQELAEIPLDAGTAEQAALLASRPTAGRRPRR